MDLLVDAIPMLGLLTGINRYLRNLYSAIEQNPDVNVSYLLRDRTVTQMPLLPGSSEWQKKNNAIRRFPEGVIFCARSLRWFQYERKLRKRLEKTTFNLFHETAFTPAKINKRIPQVFTLHDLSLKHWRQAHPRERVWFADLFLERRLREADLIITPSNFIKDELSSTMKISAAKIKAIPEAADPCFKVLPENQVDKVKKNLGLPQAYILFVGSLEPRKNIDSLIEAMNIVKTEIPLILTGWSGWGSKLWRERIRELGLDKRVIATGHISDDELVAVYNGASVLIYPSLYEGFGLPVIEAMASGCPVITSNRASLPEVSGDAAVLLENPKSAEEIAFAIESIVCDEGRQQSMCRRGLKRAEELTWAQAASESVKAFFSVCGK